jgi:hypothetical protein
MVGGPAGARTCLTAPAVIDIALDSERNARSTNVPSLFRLRMTDSALGVAPCQSPDCVVHPIQRKENR